MDLAPFLPWIVFVHVLAAFAFATGHGVSVFVAFRVRRETDRARIAALLDLSAGSLAVATLSALVLLIAGIVAGIVAGSFGRGWVWASLVLLIGVGIAMTPLGVNHLNAIRTAIGVPTRSTPPGTVLVEASADELAAVLDTKRPELLALIGGGGFVVILYLMMFRPF
jgi:hypothetical protein